MNVQRAVDAVWAFRKAFAFWWPTPPEDDAVRFAYCESGELLDALLRENDAYRRNHDRKVDWGQEMAQCAIMIVTALGPAHKYGLTECQAVLHPSRARRIDEVASRIAQGFASYTHSPGAPMWRVWFEGALIQILAEPLLAPVEERIDGELARLEASLLAPRQQAAVEACRRVADAARPGQP
jgi:hypothetical protein